MRGVGDGLRRCSLSVFFRSFLQPLGFVFLAPFVFFGGLPLAAVEGPCQGFFFAAFLVGQVAFAKRGPRSKDFFPLPPFFPFAASELSILCTLFLVIGVRFETFFPLLLSLFLFFPLSPIAFSRVPARRVDLGRFVSHRSFFFPSFGSVCGPARSPRIRQCTFPGTSPGRRQSLADRHCRPLAATPSRSTFPTAMP